MVNNNHPDFFAHPHIDADADVHAFQALQYQEYDNASVATVDDDEGWMTMIMMMMKPLLMMLMMMMMISMVMLSRHESASSDAWFHASHCLSVNVDFKHCYYFHDGEYESYSTQEYISVTVSILEMIRCFSFLIRLLHLQNLYVAAQYSEQLAFKVPIVEAVLVELDLQRLARDGAAGEVDNFHPKNERSLKLLSLVSLIKRAHFCYYA